MGGWQRIETEQLAARVELLKDERADMAGLASDEVRQLAFETALCRVSGNAALGVLAELRAR